MEFTSNSEPAFDRDAVGPEQSPSSSSEAENCPAINQSAAQPSPQVEGATQLHSSAAPQVTSVKAQRSKAQSEASKKNGRKSRGPKTKWGKRKSRGNALRHGAQSIVVVLSDPTSPHASDKAEALEKLTEEFAPRTYSETIDVDEMANLVMQAKAAERAMMRSMSPKVVVIPPDPNALALQARVEYLKSLLADAAHPQPIVAHEHLDWLVPLLRDHVRTPEEYLNGQWKGDFVAEALTGQCGLEGDQLSHFRGALEAVLAELEMQLQSQSHMLVQQHSLIRSSDQAFEKNLARIALLAGLRHRAMVGFAKIRKKLQEDGCGLEGKGLPKLATVAQEANLDVEDDKDNSNCGESGHDV